MDVIDRYSAMRLGKARYYTGKACKRNHMSERFVANGACVACTSFVRSHVIAPNVRYTDKPIVFDLRQFEPAYLDRAIELMISWADRAMARAKQEAEARWLIETFGPNGPFPPDIEPPVLPPETWKLFGE